MELFTYLLINNDLFLFIVIVSFQHTSSLPPSSLLSQCIDAGKLFQNTPPLSSMPVTLTYVYCFSLNNESRSRDQRKRQPQAIFAL